MKKPAVNAGTTEKEGKYRISGLTGDRIPICKKCNKAMYADWLCWNHYQNRHKDDGAPGIAPGYPHPVKVASAPGDSGEPHGLGPS